MTVSILFLQRLRLCCDNSVIRRYLKKKKINKNKKKAHTHTHTLYIYIYIYMHLSNPFTKDRTLDKVIFFLKLGKAGLNSEFSFSKIGCLTKAKKSVCPTIYLQLALVSRLSNAKSCYKCLPIVLNQMNDEIILFRLQMRPEQILPLKIKVDQGVIGMKEYF